MQETDNHNFNKFDQGETDWTHRDDMQALEERVPVRDLEENLGTYTPHDGARFEALDTEREFVGDGDAWNRVASTGEDPTVDSLTFETGIRDTGRWEMVHLNTWNWGGDGKVNEATHTISNFTDKPIYKCLLVAEHISVYTESGGDLTFALQINGQNTDWENRRIDGTYTTGDPHAIVTKGAGNSNPWLGQIWIHVDQDIRVRSEGAVRGQANADSHVEWSAHDGAQTERPFTVDTIRYFTPDGDQIRVRRGTLFGFTPAMNQ